MKIKTIITASLITVIVAPVLFLASASWQIKHSAKGLTSSVLADVPAKKVALVLGCSPRVSNGRENLFFQYRMKAAAELWKAGKVKYLLLSGDHRQRYYNEPLYMQNALVKLGVPKNRTVLDYAGIRTLDSVVRAKEVFGETDLIVVSQAFHNERSIFIGKHRGLTLFGYNAKGVSYPHAKKTLLREELAKIKALLDVTFLNTQPKHLGSKIKIGDTPSSKENTTPMR